MGIEVEQQGVQVVVAMNSVVLKVNLSDYQVKLIGKG